MLHSRLLIPIYLEEKEVCEEKMKKIFLLVYIYFKNLVFFLKKKYHLDTFISILFSGALSPSISFSVVPDERKVVWSQSGGIL